MAKGYILAEVEVTDQAKYDTYRAQVAATLVPYGGRFLVRGGNPEALEGDGPMHRFVILEFDSVEKAGEWYHSEQYGRVKAVRLQAARSRLVLLTGAG